MGLFNNKKEEAKQETSYFIEDYTCQNCGYTYADEEDNYEIEVPIGITIGKFLKDKVCKNCGCKIIQNVHIKEND